MPRTRTCHRFQTHTSFTTFAVGDRVATPPENAQHYTERLLLLPSFYHVNGHWHRFESPPPPRAAREVMLEEGGQVVRFPDESDCDDIGMAWAELLGEQPCLASASEMATLHMLPQQSLTPQPRGAPPRNAVWDQREGAWIGSDGVPLNDVSHDCALHAGGFISRLPESARLVA